LAITFAVKSGFLSTIYVPNAIWLGKHLLVALERLPEFLNLPTHSLKNACAGQAKNIKLTRELTPIPSKKLSV